MMMCLAQRFRPGQTERCRPSHRHGPQRGKPPCPRACALRASRHVDRCLRSAKYRLIIDRRRPPADGGRDTCQGCGIPAAGCILERGGFGAVYSPTSKAARCTRKRGCRVSVNSIQRDERTVRQGTGGLVMSRHLVPGSGPLPLGV
jgi:hypothetical protein